MDSGMGTIESDTEMVSSLPYERLNADGLSHSHLFAIEEIPSGSRVLDIGCASGYVARALREKGCTTFGVDPDAAAVKSAEAHCEQTIVGDIESEALRRRLPLGFDVVTLLDTLEHLRDPWDALAFARTRLADGGIVVVSIPNTGVWFARLTLLRGHFPREAWGIFDRTHLRFFTRESIHALAADSGFRVLRERPVPTVLPGEGLVRRVLAGSPEARISESDAVTATPMMKSAARLRALAARARPELFAQQLVLVLEPR